MAKDSWGVLANVCEYWKIVRYFTNLVRILEIRTVKYNKNQWKFTLIIWKFHVSVKESFTLSC